MLLASTNIFTTHPCNGSVALEAASQSLATFNAQIVPIDVELHSTKTKKNDTFVKNTNARF